jgi:cob(I)alamin adenosyltransferase
MAAQSLADNPFTPARNGVYLPERLPMGNRLSRIYTRTGDDGTTGLGDGTRVSKQSARIEAIGAIDELNSQLGLLLTEAALPQAIRETLTQVQHALFELGGELSIPNHARITGAMVTQLEQELDRLNETLPPLKEFILPGGSRAAALAHVARAVCRRAERRLVALAGMEDVSPLAIQYTNRLSDLLFVMARAINRHHAVPDVLWQPR